MFIKKLSVQGYRCFFDKCEVNFSIPDGKPGSGMTILVGANNSGKTTFIEGFKKITPRDKNQKYIYDDESNSNEFKLKIMDFEDNHKYVKRVNATSASLEIKGDSKFYIESYTLIPSRRHRQSRYNAPTSYNGYSKNVFGRDKNTVDSHFGGLLEYVQNNEKIKKYYNETLQYLLPNISDRSVQRTREGPMISIILDDGSKHPADFLGDGVISIFQLVAAIIDQEKNIIIIDEPEVSLQPDVCRKLTKILGEVAKRKQVIITTHSPYFIDWHYVSNGASIHRFEKKSVSTNIFFIDKSNSYYSEIIRSQNRQTPHLMDVVAKEILFTQNVLFLEGQEDASLLRSYISENDIDCNFTIFGYGVGGADNTDWYLGLSKDLGIKAGALLDADKSAKTKQLVEMFPEFKIGMISTDDIRDKYKQKYSSNKVEKINDYYLVHGRGKNSKELVTLGLFDKDGKIKDTAIKEINTIISEYNIFFSKDIEEKIE